MTIKTIPAQYGQTWDCVEGLEQTSVIRMHPVAKDALDAWAEREGLNDRVFADPSRIEHGLKIQVIDAYTYPRQPKSSRSLSSSRPIPPTRRGLR